MKRIVTIFILCFSAVLAQAQVIAVTATITDSDGQTWNNGTFSAVLFSPNGAPFYNGTPVSTVTQKGNLSSSGALAVSLNNTNTITPGGAQYQWTICSNTSAPCSQFLAPVTTTNLSTLLSSLVTAPRFAAGPTAFGYLDIEASPIPPPGGGYFNVTLGNGQVWNGTTWVNSGGGGGSSNPSTCTVNSGTDICVTLPPYYASNAGATTTTASIGSGSTSTTVASCSTFLANEYILIPGAGSGGANFLAPLVSCTGTTMTWTGATSTTVTSVTILHDESNAIQAAITALASTGGNIYFPDGVYLVNGPLQDTSGANSILLMPSIASVGNSTTTRFIGFKEPASLANSVQPTGAVIQNTLGSSGNILSGFCHSSCSELSFTNAGIDMEYLTILAPTNPSISAINAGWISTARFYHIAVGTGNSSLPTNTATGILFPYAGNDVRLSSTDLYVSGYGTCVQTGEHTTILELGESNCIEGIVPQSRPGAPYAGNIQHIVHAWCQVCTYQLAAAPNAATIKIDSLDIESAARNGILDPLNLLYGDVGFNVQASAGAVTPTNPAVNGAANLCIHNIQFPNAATFGGACPAASSSFPITLGSTSVAASSTTTAISGLTLNGLTIGNVSGVNDTITAGGNFGADFIDLYASGSNKYYWGLNTGEMQFGVQDNTTSHYSFNAASGGLQASGSNEYGRLTPRTSGGGWSLASGELYGWSSSSTNSGSGNDTGLSRDSAGVVDVGNGTPGNKSGTFNLTNINLTGTCTGCSSSSSVSLRGTITLTAATSDNATITGVTSSSNCVFSPTNSIAAASQTILAYISGTSTNTVTVTHAGTVANGAILNIHCTVN